MRDEREAKLPAWAQQMIASLRLRAATATEVGAKEIATLRARNELLERRTSALEELLTCAAKGGHKTAQEIISVLESYSLSVVKEG